MFISMRKYSGVRSRDEAIRRIEENLIPILRAQPGFISYYLVDFEDGDIGSTSVYGTREDADEAARTVQKWIEENLSDLIPNAPKINRGKVLVHETIRAIGQAR